MKRKVWSCAQANSWYAEQPWFRGCNYLPADCCNRIAFWQELDFEKHLATMESEMELMAQTGFNSIRLILELIVWDQEHDSFLRRFERVIDCAARHGIGCVICFGNDCTVPKDEKYVPPQLGEQKFDWGYHGGRKNSPHSGYKDAVGFNPYLDIPENAEKFYAMVREIVGLYAEDPRIILWDLFNEPGNGNRGEVSVPHVQRIFDEARTVETIQPMTSGLWHFPGDETPAEKLAMQLSDVISFHNYAVYWVNVVALKELKKWDRPLFNTEWLHRINGCCVQDLYPLFYLEKISCWNWGLVAGLSQTYEPWESNWKSWDNGEKTVLDMTKWQHDLFRPNHRPYDPREIDLIKRINNYAAKEEEK